MKKILKCIIGTITSCGLVFCLGMEANAAIPSNYGECKSLSGDRMGIRSVEWACQTKFPNGGGAVGSNVCSLWIGNDAEAKIDQITLSDKFKVTEDEYFAPIKYYGMCTNNAADGVIKVCKVGSVDYVDGPASSGGKRSCSEYDFISQTKTVSRGSWGTPGYGTGAELNVGEFLKVANKSSDDRGDWYRLPVDIFRCYGSSLWYSTVKDACSQMVQDITVLIPKSAQKFLGVSSVSNRDSQTSGSNQSDFATTNITDEYKTASTPEIKDKKVGDKVSLTFSHNVFTVLQASGVNWSVSRTMTYNGTSQAGFNSDNYTIEAPSNGNSSGETNSPHSRTGRTGSDRSDNWLYFRVLGDPDYTDGGGKYALRDFYTVTFKKSGTYEFCEELSVNGNNLTKVCSKIVVGGGSDDGSDFYSISNVSNSHLGGYSTTGLNNGALVTVETDTATAKVGESVDIVFSHNIYAIEPTNGVAWRVTREGLSGVAGATITRQSGSGLTSALSGTSNLTVSENGKYAAEGRQGSDGANSYLVREKFTVKFTKKNAAGYTFCETMGMTVNGTQRDYTKACTTVRVTDGDDEEKPQLCDAWAPVSYTSSNASSGTTSVVMRIQNDRLAGAYSGWRGKIDEGTSPGAYVALNDRITYAKPGDTVQWAACYWPGVQKVADTEVTYKDAGHPTYLGSGNATNTNENYKFSNSKFGTWENKYNIEASSGISPSPSSGSALVGDSTTRMSTTNYSVRPLTDVGKYYEETIRGGYSPVWASSGVEEPAGYSWSCNPYRCPYDCPPCDDDGCSTCWTTCWHSCSHTNANFWKNRINGPVVSGAARVEIPYNFVNETGVSVSITSSNSQDAVYAGETIRVDNPYVNVYGEGDEKGKYNNLTEYQYATVVDNAQVRLIAYASVSPNGGVRTLDGSAGSDVCGLINDDLSGYCETVKSASGRLNETGSLYGTDYTNRVLNTSFNGIYNVFDVDAGNQMCFVMAVYPYTSGDDNNLSADGNRKWFISAPACKVVAKKPSVQVFGGGVFSAGSIRTNTSDKINILGIAGYTSQGASNRRVFGSWAEQAVISNGSIEGFASGAATGVWNLGGSNSDRLGGSWEGDTTSFCNNRVPLSFANTSSSYITGICPGAEATGRLGISVSTVNRQALVDYFAAGTRVDGSNGWDGFGGYVRIASGTEKNILYSEETNDSYNISGGTIGGDTTRIVKVTGNININGNILYNNSQNYTLIKAAGTVTVPKTVIYASGNINIACSVSEIDAILIAGGKVSTCSGYSATDTNTWQNPIRNNKLTIRGAVVANRIDFGRTYGNTTGLGTKEPAEEINYDTSAILWGRSMADAGESDTLTVVYQHELAPRY